MGTIKQSNTFNADRLLDCPFEIISLKNRIRIIYINYFRALRRHNHTAAMDQFPISLMAKFMVAAAMRACHLEAAPPADL